MAFKIITGSKTLYTFAYYKSLDDNSCTAGYVHMIGDKVGASFKMNIRATVAECAAECSANEDCRSFESNSVLCNLNKERHPNGPNYADYIFCSKKGCKLTK